MTATTDRDLRPKNDEENARSCQNALFADRIQQQQQRRPYQEVHPSNTPRPQTISSHYSQRPTGHNTTSTKMKIVLVSTSASELQGHPTGLWLEEFATPYYMFKEKGYDVVMASPGTFVCLFFRLAAFRNKAVINPLPHLHTKIYASFYFILFFSPPKNLSVCSWWSDPDRWK